MRAVWRVALGVQYCARANREANAQANTQRGTGGLKEVPRTERSVLHSVHRHYRTLSKRESVWKETREIGKGETLGETL